MSIMSDDISNEKVEKLLIDNLSDFRFHAAYLAYSKAWVENPDEEARLELNKVVLSLTENKENYSSFYYELNQIGGNVPDNFSGRVRFKSQRKRDWRRSEAKKNRLSRHKR